MDRIKELWSELLSIKEETPLIDDNPEQCDSDNSPAQLANHCHTRVERLLAEFKQISNPIEPGLTEDDLSAFWQD